MAMWIASDISVDPPSVEIAAKERIAVGIDMTNVLGVGDTITAPGAFLRSLDTEAVTSLDEPAVASNVITVVIDGETLEFGRGETYELVVWFTASVNRRPARVLVIEVVA